MNLYAESSAVLAWLLGEARAEDVRDLLAGAESVLTSELTIVECERALVRAVAGKTISEACAMQRKDRLEATAAGWDLVRLEERVLRRARKPFPAEPIRTLDAIHLAAAIVIRDRLPDLRVLSLDRRVREGAEGLGFPLLPADGDHRSR